MVATLPGVLGATLALLGQATPRAKPQDTLTPHRAVALRFVTEAVASEDGSQIAYALSVPRRPGKDEDGAPWVELHVADVETGASRGFVTGEVNVAAIEWTPDGGGLSFLAKRGKDKTRSLYVVPVDGGEARVAIALDSDIAAYSWSPDGKQAACIAPEAEPESRRKARERGFQQTVYEEELRFSRVWIAEPFAKDVKPRALPLTGHATAVIWSPAGPRLGVVLAPTPLVDDGYTSQRIHVVDAATGAVVAKVPTEGKLGPFSWSPDGKHLALIAGADAHDPHPGRLFVADATTGAYVLRDPAGFEDADAQQVAWSAAKTLRVVVDEGVHTRIATLALPGAEPESARPIAGEPDRVVLGLRLAKTAPVAALQVQRATHPTEVYAWALGAGTVRRITRSNPELEKLRFAKQEVVKWKARDGLDLEGVLIRPLQEEPGKRAPLIVEVHGGPESHYRDGWLSGYFLPGQMAAARGYAVFHPNYRGSTGRGHTFAVSSQGDPAGAEFDDLVDGVDALVASGLADRDKVGITGGSYGGYATAWCSTRFTSRFAAGVMFVGISDVISKVGTTDIPNEEFLVHARKRPWEDWDFFLKRSPIYYAQQSRTPLLILGGKDDPRVDPGQSRELYRHLKLAGKSPVRLVQYPGEGHGNAKACARLDFCLRMMQWFDHYLLGPGGDPPPAEIAYDDPSEGKEKKTEGT